MPNIKSTNLNKSISVKPQVFNTPLGVGDIGSSAKNAEKARIWAEGTDPEVETLGGEHSAKVWAEEAKKSAGGGTWGSITGTLSDQTDLQTALNSKLNKSDVTSEYSATGLDPVNGTAVASALANMAPASTTVLGPVKVDGTTITAADDGTISAVLPSNVVTTNDIASMAYNFSSSNYLTGKTVLDFESASTYTFVFHFTTRSSSSSYGNILFSTATSESDINGFDLNFNSSNNLWISQSGVNSSSTWALDDNLATGLSLGTEYWLKIAFDGTEYVYTTATDRNFTNIVNTVTNVSSEKIKNGTQQNPRFGKNIRTNIANWYWRGNIFISDCYLEFDGVKVFDGSRGFDSYSLQGTVGLVTTVQKN